METLYKEIVSNLRIKAKMVANGVACSFKDRDVQAFIKLSPFIDSKAKNLFCNDAFEIAWDVEKAHYLLKICKRMIK